MNILLLIAILAAWLVLSLLVASHVGKLLAYARQTQTRPLHIPRSIDTYSAPLSGDFGYVMRWDPNGNESVEYVCCECRRHAVSPQCPRHGKGK